MGKKNQIKKRLKKRKPELQALVGGPELKWGWCAKDHNGIIHGCKAEITSEQSKKLSECKNEY